MPIQWGKEFRVSLILGDKRFPDNNSRSVRADLILDDPPAVIINLAGLVWKEEVDGANCSSCATSMK